MLHLAQRRFHGSTERRIDLRDRRDDRRYPLFHDVRNAVQRFIHGRRQLILQQLVERRFVLRLECFEGQRVLGQEAQRGRVHDGCRRALVHQRHGHVEVAIDLTQLTQVGQLVGARHVTDGGKQRVLDDGAQQDVGAEMVRRSFDFRDERRERSFSFAYRHRTAAVPNAFAAVIQMKERDGIVMRRDLRVITGGDERFPSGSCQPRGLAGVEKFVREHMGDERLRGRIGGVVDDEPMGAQDGLDPSTKRLRHRVPGCIGPADVREDGRLEF